jgi:hypothetical protein
VETVKNICNSISEPLLLLRYLKIYNFDLEKAKSLLVVNLEMRKKYPMIFENRDLLSAEIQQALHTFHLFDLPQKTAEHHKISIFRLANKNPDEFDIVNIVRMASCSLDGRFVRQDEGELIDGDFMVFDMSGYTFKHLMKCASNLSLIRAYLKVIIERHLKKNLFTFLILLSTVKRLSH